MHHSEDPPMMQLRLDAAKNQINSYMIFFNFLNVTYLICIYNHFLLLEINFVY